MSPRILSDEPEFAEDVAYAEKLGLELISALGRFKPTFATLLKLAQANQQMVDTTIDTTVRVFEKEHPVPCSGCRTGLCCSIRVDASVIDGIRAALYLGPTLLPKLPELARLHQAQSSVSADDWYARHIPCFFLADGHCTIYPVRPSACRAYFVTPDASRCGGSGTINIMDPAIVQLRAFPTKIAVDWLLAGDSGLGLSTFPGAVWAIGKNLRYKDDLPTFRKRLRRDWSPLHGWWVDEEVP